MSTLQNEKDVRAAFIGASQEIHNHAKASLEKVFMELEKNLKTQYETLRQVVSSSVKLAAVGDPAANKAVLEQAVGRLNDNVNSFYYRNQNGRVAAPGVSKEVDAVDQPAAPKRPR